MKQALLSEIIVFELFMFVTLLTIILLVAKTNYNIKLNKKFSYYTINPINDNSISLLDKIYSYFNVIINKFSCFFNKSKLLKKYALTYEKHMSGKDYKKEDPMRYVSLKVIIGIGMIFLYLLISLIRLNSIHILVLLLAFFIGFFALDIYIKIIYHINRKKIKEDLLKSIIIMNNAFSTGRSITQAIEIVKNELDGPISEEFHKIYIDLMYGLSIEVVFDRFYNRIKLEDVKYIASSLTLLNKTGGNIVKVFEAIEKEFFDKKKLHNELKSMTASSLFIFKLLLILPFILYLVIILLNKKYFEPLFNTKIGICILFVIAFLYVIYILLVKKITKVDI